MATQHFDARLISLKLSSCSSLVSHYHLFFFLLMRKKLFSLSQNNPLTPLPPPIPQAISGSAIPLHSAVVNFNFAFPKPIRLSPSDLFYPIPPTITQTHSFPSHHLHPSHHFTAWGLRIEGQELSSLSVLVRLSCCPTPVGALLIMRWLRAFSPLGGARIPPRESS